MTDRQPDSDPNSVTSSDPGADFRWTAFFQRSTEPVFVLNRRRQILFVNRAWESLTAHTLRDVHKRPCRRRRDAEPGSCEALLSALSPPREALGGRTARVRRLIVLAEAKPQTWDVEFLPLLGPNGVLGLIGKVEVVAAGQQGVFQPLPAKLMALRARLTASWGLQHISTEVPALRRVAEQVRLASRTNVAVLLQGESGVGKQWLARTIHQESPNREQPFFALDCRHLPAAALAWSLFGPPSFAQRQGATLYLQEPSVLPREIQARLSEQFAEAEDNPGPRLLAGTTADSLAEIRAGRLLEEFHCLLTPVTIQVPPLRERLGELPTLVDRLQARASAGRETAVSGLTEDAWELLRAYAWPGNLRELYAVLAEACRRAKGSQLEAADLPWYLRSVAPLPERILPLDKLLEQAEKRLMQWAITTAKGNKSRAAELLEITRPRLLRRMAALGI